ncbi:MAG: DMT family transporter [Oligoflexia bacterium]|nr:DMT family transporter [Oligoflexia bacterium]
MRANPLLGPGLIAFAAVLWATDAPFRYPMLQKLDTVSIVFLEHVFATIALLLWAWVKRPRGLFKFSARGWLGLVLIGAGASAGATLLFTASFRYVNPSVAILLQKLQPVLVMLLALLFLGERPKAGFYGWAVLALGAGTVLSFPTLDFSFIRKGLDVHSRGVVFALGAAAIWASSTVAGKALLNRSHAPVLTFWRYTFGLATLAVLMVRSGQGIPLAVVQSEGMVLSFAYLSFISGLLAMVCYYGGLSRATASIATFVELLYPITAVIVNTVVLQTPLDPIQAVAAALLLFAVTRISLLN